MRWRKSSDAATSAVAIVPDYAEPLCAWRLWELEDCGGPPRLRSLYRPSIWPAGAPFEAQCEAQRLRLSQRPRHAAPSETCTCGVYGAPFELLRRKLVDDEWWFRFVIGTVSLWGDVIECERGWRAELAYPSRLFVPLGVPGAVKHVVGLRDYGVPVELVDTRSVDETLDDVAELAA